MPLTDCGPADRTPRREARDRRESGELGMADAGAVAGICWKCCGDVNSGGCSIVLEAKLATSTALDVPISIP